MNSNSKNEKLNKNLPKVEESASVYQSKSDLDKENNIGFDIDGNEITGKDFVSDAQNALKLFQDGTSEGSNSEKMNPILIKIISKSIQDSKEGKGISNDEMSQKIKSKYPFLK